MNRKSYYNSKIVESSEVHGHQIVKNINKPIHLNYETKTLSNSNGGKKY